MQIWNSISNLKKKFEIVLNKKSVSEQNFLPEPNRTLICHI